MNSDIILEICKRPFENIEAMHKTLIENWNSVVADKDEVYILGDFVYKGTGLEANEILRVLKGKKYLVKGNHEKYLKDPAFKPEVFEWIKDYHVLIYEKRKIILFHYPIFEWDNYFHGAIHLYGHVHNGGNDPAYQEKFNVLGKKAVNVGVDVQNFFPVSIKNILEITGTEA